MDETQATTAQAEIVIEPLAEANTTVNNHTAMAAGVGLIPFPLLDMVAITGLQINMLSRLCAIYGVPFSQDRAKHIVASLVGGAGTYYLSPPVMSLVKFIPLVGQAAAMLTMPAIAGASTYAVGKVFIRHFESGGTFLTFDPAKTKEYFSKMYAEGKEVANSLKQSVKSSGKKNTTTAPEEATTTV
ncbi:YcjF family protein [Chrysiogenes arsenatis]|uniref:YcjF family protein n=1 Tax=Chrysiogenes arsenatis TaxID=309797 RepID=UPI0003F6EC93|nr:DUF697 domain-containing protein [Chrysiogenes arsenatis]